MPDENPYEPSVFHERALPRNRLTLALWWMIYLQPAMTLLLVYACWAITSVSLGRPPSFGEHPENELADSMVHFLGTPAALLTLSTPLFVPAALAWGFLQPFGASRPATSIVKTRVACLTPYLFVLAFVALIWRSDPFGVVYWFID